MRTILLFDSSDINKYNIHIKLSNTTEEIEKMLTNAPVIDGEFLIGYTLSAENKTGTSLYYGNVEFLDTNYNNSNTKIIDYDVIFKEPPVNGIYEALMIAIIVKRE